MTLVAATLSCLLALAGCKTPEGYGPRSTMSDEDASAACLDELSSLVAASDADGLVAAFSEGVRSANPGLTERAGDLMSTIGGGTVEDGHFNQSVGNIRSGSIYVVSTATVTAPDGSVWQLRATDCTFNRDDPARVGLRTVEVIPNSALDAPQGFSWYGTDDSRWPSGIRLIRSWDGWDPYTSPYSPDW